jgi:hypothetical protein
LDRIVGRKNLVVQKVVAELLSLVCVATTLGEEVNAGVANVRSLEVRYAGETFRNCASSFIPLYFSLVIDRSSAIAAL